jgi:3-phosphoshikimate 1-carboxyvinyltransferase
MAFAIASARSNFELDIEGVDNVKTSFPNFVELVNQVGMNLIETQ